MPIPIETIEKEKRRIQRLSRPLGDKIYEVLNAKPKHTFTLDEIKRSVEGRTCLVSTARTPAQLITGVILEVAKASTDEHAKKVERYEQALQAESEKGRVRKVEHQGITRYCLPDPRSGG